MAGWIKSRRQGGGSAVIVIERVLPGEDGNPTVVEDFRNARGPLEATQAWWVAMGWEPHVMAGYFTTQQGPVISHPPSAELPAHMRLSPDGVPVARACAVDGGCDGD